MRLEQVTFPPQTGRAVLGCCGPFQAVSSLPRYIEIPPVHSASCAITLHWSTIPVPLHFHRPSLPTTDLHSS
jgi:hypothetical protein